MQTTSSNQTLSKIHLGDASSSVETHSTHPVSFYRAEDKGVLGSRQGPCWVWDLERDSTSYFCKTRQRTIELKTRPSVPPGAFCIFSQEQKTLIRKACPNLRSKVLMQRVQKAWKKTDQKHYKHLAAEMYSDYRLLLSWWRAEFEGKTPAEEQLHCLSLRTQSSAPIEPYAEEAENQILSLRPTTVSQISKGEKSADSTSKDFHGLKPSRDHVPLKDHSPDLSVELLDQAKTGSAQPERNMISGNASCNLTFQVEKRNVLALPPCSWVMANSASSPRSEPCLSGVDRSVLKQGILGKRNPRWAAVAYLFNEILPKLPELEKRARIHSSSGSIGS